MRHCRRTSSFILLLMLGSVGCGDNVDSRTQPPTASVTDELFARRYVAAGDRAYVIGMADGSFAPAGWHIRGELGGVWAHPIKLLDGYWFAIDGAWLPDAIRQTTGVAYAELEFPQKSGLTVTRVEFSPDSAPVVVVELTVKNHTDAARSARLTMEMRSELMGSYPGGWTSPDAAAVNGKDDGMFEAGQLFFTEPDKPWTAIVAAVPEPASLAVGDEYWGPVTAAQRPDYLEYGNGTGGQLEWDLSVPPQGKQTLWIAIAGSHTSKSEAQSAIDLGLDDPEKLLEEKIAARMDLLALSEIDLPEPRIKDAFDWSKLNMADLRITVTDMQIRDVNEGKDYPEPVGTLAKITGIGAGFPDYPWYFGTDGAYTSFPLVVSGQWDTAMDHLRGIRDVSIAINGNTGKVVHEVMTDGSVYFGNNAASGNTNETAQFIIAVDLLWRWTGDDEFRDEMFEFMKNGLQFITSSLDVDGDGWSEGHGMVERPGMGSEKLDVTAYTWLALVALKRMAEAVADTDTATWARLKHEALDEAFVTTWWMPDENRYADSLCNAGDELDPPADAVNICTAPDTQLQQRHWINAVPMEVKLGARQYAEFALEELEAHSGPCGLYHTGHMGGPKLEGELKCWTLPNSVMAVAEANYGRLRDNQALFYIRAIADLLNLEMPGALPEISSSPQYNPFADLRERAMFMQAWSPYGVQWPIIHHFLGVDPDVPAKRLKVIPDVPESWPLLSVKNLRVGTGTIEVAARRDPGGIYTTEVKAEPGMTLIIGHTLPRDADIQSVLLDGVPVQQPISGGTLRGLEVHVETDTDSLHTLVVIAR